MNLQKMMQQAQALQSKIGELQKKLEGDEIEGESGGGLVKARINGKGHALAITLDPKVVDPSDKETLEDLIVAAFNNAKAKMDEHFSSEMNKLTAGLPLPPGFKLPM